MTDLSQQLCSPFVQHFDPTLGMVRPAQYGSLQGLRFGVKDNFDIEGYVTGGGSPAWAKTHKAALKNAAAVDILLRHGATIAGKTHMDELAYSLMGMNAQYGTPPNPRAPQRAPGGSSSGSASAVAGGQVDAAIGTDTGGSVRIPASFCGLYGLRPSHGRIDCSGLLALAPSFDVVGFFARDPQTMVRIGQAFDIAANVRTLTFHLPDDVWAMCGDATANALKSVLPERLRPQTSTGFGKVFHSLENWRRIFQIIQAYEVWKVFGAWIVKEQPSFGSGIRERFEMASKITETDWRQAVHQRTAIREQVFDLLQKDRVLVFPTAPGPAPLLTVDQPELERYRNAALNTLCIAGLCGLPQLSIPIANVAGAPVGISLVGPYGLDGALLQTAVDLAAAS